MIKTKRITKLKQLFTILFAFILFMTYPTNNVNAANNQTFLDVKTTHWAYNHIMNLHDKEIINGYRDGRFGTSDSLSRGQASTMIVKGADLDYRGKRANFKDVSETNEFSSFIAALVDEGAVRGYRDGRFGSDDEITRGQIAAMVVRAFDLKEGTVETNFTDTMNNEFRGFIHILASNNIVNGYGDGRYGPDDSVTRAEFSVILSKAMIVSATELKEETVRENEIDYTTIEQEDNTLLEGKKELFQEGVNGFDEVVYLLTYVNGVEKARTEASRVTVDPIPKIIKVGTRVDVESISLTPEKLTLTEGENYSIVATVLPENATNKNLLWTSSDENVATVNEHGSVLANSSGETTITVTDSTENVTENMIVTVKKPTIESIENITIHTTQFDDFTLPGTVTALMSNGTTTEHAVNWSDDTVDTSKLGVQYFEGAVENYDQPITLKLIINEYNPQLTMNAYSSITINNLSRGLNMSMNNNGTKPVNIDRIEIYEKGRLYATYTPGDLISSGISTTIQPGENWGISITFRTGMWLDGSYVKYFISANNTDYEYEISLER